MRELVGDQRHQRSIPGDDGGRGERQAWILHPAEWKRRRKHEQVVAPPAIRARQPFGGFHHPLHIDELRGGAIQPRGLGVDGGAGTDRLVRDVADRQRDQVRRHGIRHPELERPLAARSRGGFADVLRAHHRAKRRRNRDLRAVGLPDAGAVLRGDPRPGENRLSLREQVGLPLAGRLLGSEPLKRGSCWPCLVGDDDRPIAAAQFHRERPSLDGISVAKNVLEYGASAIRDLLDLEIASVEHQFCGAGTAPHGQRRRPAELVRLHIGAEVERYMRDASLGRPCERVDVDRVLVRGSAGLRRLLGGWTRHATAAAKQREPERRTSNKNRTNTNENVERQCHPKTRRCMEACRTPPGRPRSDRAASRSGSTDR